MPVSRLAAVTWFSGVLAVTSISGIGIYQLTSTSSTVGSSSLTTSQNGGPSSAGGNTSNPGHDITLTGAVSGTLRPGSPATLNVTITNPNNQDIIVTSVTGNITSVSTGNRVGLPSCDAAWFHVGTFTGPKKIAKNKSGSVTVPLFLDNLNVNQDNCMGATVQFSFAAQAQAS